MTAGLTPPAGGLWSRGLPRSLYTASRTTISLITVWMMARRHRDSPAMVGPSAGLACSCREASLLPVST